MAMTGVGYAGIGEILDAQKVIQMEDVLHYDHDLNLTAPWQAYDSRIGQTRDTGNMEFKWLTKAASPYSVALASGYTAGALAFVVAAGYGKFFSPNAVIVGQNNVQYLVTSVDYTTTPDTITVTKRDGAADANMASGALLFILPTAISDKASATAGFKTEAVEKTSWCQNFTASVSISDIAQLSEFYGDKDPRATMHRERQFEIMRMRELSRLYGKGIKIGPTSGVTTWIADGMRANVGNTWDFSNAVITLDLINAQLPALLEKIELSKLAFFVPPGFISKFCADGLGKVLLSPDNEKWGMKVNQLLTYAGPLDMIPEPMMRTYVGTSTGAGKEALLVCLDECKKVTFKNGGLKVLANRQNPVDFQNILDIYSSRTGFQYGNNAKHTLLTNFQYA